ncbi:hypothetical protein QCA50_017204 [Cerrena zonata]|uniref:Protein kinase domain-containing protein n=1 Tax=Cerrena zonata TaxID=2478898 RepID=A0AAW0FSM8_9APHY
MITNFHHTLYIEIDESRLSQLKELTDDNNEVEIPCNYKLLSLEGRGLTVQAVLLNLLFIESADKEELLEKYQEKVFNIIDNITSKKHEEQGKLLDPAIKDSLVKETLANSNINPQKSNSHVEGECESWTGFEVLQGEGHRRHVYKFQVDLLCKFFPFFNEVLTGLKQDDLVIMKLFIPSVVARLRGWPIPDTEDVKACIHSFLKEASCYELIERHNSSSDDEKDKINIPTLYYYGAFRMNVKDLGPIEGYYLLLSYVEEDETIITKSMVENGCRQLELMGDIGIQHHDIATRNCKVADGNIVFLDFSHAKNLELKYDNSDDIHDLKYIYEYDKLEESDDDNYSAISSAPFSEVQFPSTAGTEPTKPDSK